MCIACYSGAKLTDRRVYFSLLHPHILSMTTWTKTFKREPPRTKAELREMLTEAVRNTQPELKRPPQAKRDRSEKAA
jgi:hypothetical protein